MRSRQRSHSDEDERRSRGSRTSQNTRSHEVQEEFTDSSDSQSPDRSERRRHAVSRSGPDDFNPSAASPDGDYVERHSHEEDGDKMKIIPTELQFSQTKEVTASNANINWQNISAVMKDIDVRKIQEICNMVKKRSPDTSQPHPASTDDQPVYTDEDIIMLNDSPDKQRRFGSESRYHERELEYSGGYPEGDYHNDRRRRDDYEIDDSQHKGDQSSPRSPYSYSRTSRRPRQSKTPDSRGSRERIEKDNFRRKARKERKNSERHSTISPKSESNDEYSSQSDHRDYQQVDSDSDEPIEHPHRKWQRVTSEERTDSMERSARKSNRVNSAEYEDIQNKPSGRSDYPHHGRAHKRGDYTLDNKSSKNRDRHASTESTELQGRSPTSSSCATFPSTEAGYTERRTIDVNSSPDTVKWSQEEVERLDYRQGRHSKLSPHGLEHVTKFDKKSYSSRKNSVNQKPEYSETRNIMIRKQDTRGNGNHIPSDKDHSRGIERQKVIRDQQVSDDLDLNIKIHVKRESVGEKREIFNYNRDADHRSQLNREQPNSTTTQPSQSEPPKGDPSRNGSKWQSLPPSVPLKVDSSSSGSKWKALPQSETQKIDSRRTGSKWKALPQSEPRKFDSSKTGSKRKALPQSEPPKIDSSKTGSKWKALPQSEPQRTDSSKTGSKWKALPQSEPPKLDSSITGSKWKALPQSEPQRTDSSKTGSKWKALPRSELPKSDSLINPMGIPKKKVSSKIRRSRWDVSTSPKMKSTDDESPPLKKGRYQYRVGRNKVDRRNRSRSPDCSINLKGPSQNPDTKSIGKLLKSRWDSPPSQKQKVELEEKPTKSATYGRKKTENTSTATNESLEDLENFLSQLKKKKGSNA